MRFSSILSLITLSLSEASDFHTYPKGKEIDGGRSDRSLNVFSSVYIYTSKVNWLRALEDNVAVADENFLSLLSGNWNRYTLTTGSNDIGLFDIDISSTYKPNSLFQDYNGEVVFDGQYKKDTLDVTFNDFDDETIYAFAGEWKVKKQKEYSKSRDEVKSHSGDKSVDFYLMVNGVSVNIGDFLQKDRFQFIGIIDFDGFNEIEFYTSEDKLMSVSLKDISLSSGDLISDTLSPTISLAPSVTPSISHVPTISNHPSGIPSSPPTIAPTQTRNPSTVPSSAPSNGPSFWGEIFTSFFDFIFGEDFQNLLNQLGNFITNLISGQGQGDDDSQNI